MNKVNTAGVDVFCSPINIHLPTCLQSMKTMKVAAQNLSAYGKGAYTGEVTGAQLTDLGVGITLIGHSERRTYFGEIDKTVGTKVANAQAEDLLAVVCLGETDKQRKDGKVNDVLLASMKEIVANVKDWSKVILAYEPVWAIGTGNVCSPEIAQEVCSYLRAYLKETAGANVANNTRIIYGGSVKPKSAAALIAKADVDGFLVGGASLKPDMFGDIIKHVQAQAKGYSRL